MGRLSGRAGNAVFVNTGSGTIMRALPDRNDPQTSAQLLNRARQTYAARIWSNLEPEVVERWATYGKTIGMRPMNAFTTLYKRLLSLDMAAPPPLFPPARPFFGDVIEVGVASSAEAATTPLDLELGSLTFTSSAPNTAGIVTEIFLQRLASRNRRTYIERYRSQGFTAFPGGTAHAVPCPLGWYACAYRFVNQNTGQATEIAELGIVLVEA